MLFTLCEWLHQTAWSVALRESIWVYPVIESTHLLTVGVFFGLTVYWDLRLIGRALRDVRVADVSSRLLPWIRWSFGVMCVSGVLLFYSAPATFYGNVFFRAKLVLLLAAGLNVWLFHRGIGRSEAEWGTGERLPLRARIAGATSVALWVSVIAVGRLIAYNWFK